MDEYHFQVTVIGSSNTSHTKTTHTKTTHKVTIQPDYALKLTAGKITNAQLVEKSFVFLLEREANTSIMPNFDLSVIARYFPEYESIIAR